MGLFNYSEAFVFHYVISRRTSDFPYLSRSLHNQRNLEFRIGRNIHVNKSNSLVLQMKKSAQKGAVLWLRQHSMSWTWYWIKFGILCPSSYCSTQEQTHLWIPLNTIWTVLKSTVLGTSLLGPVVKNLPLNAGDVDLIPGPGTKILHAMKQLSLGHNSRVCVPRWKIPCDTEDPACTTKIWDSQIDK